MPLRFRLASGTISLHDETGVPLRGLGLGSIRLLLAGLQRQAAAGALDHLDRRVGARSGTSRIIMLLGTLGAKEKSPPLQVFMTTHSPVVVCELSAEQLFVLRRGAERHNVLEVGAAGDVQGTIRKFPYALLAKTSDCVEGASEVGLIRGLDQFSIANGTCQLPLMAARWLTGVATSCSLARSLPALGYRVATLRDSDVHPTPDLEAKFAAAGGHTFRWREGHALEDEVFMTVSIRRFKSCWILLSRQKRKC